jgi:flagellar protein FlbT
MFLFDACVITLAMITYLNYKEAMYTLVAVFVGARVIDFIQDGAYAAKAAMIISEHNAEIANRIIKELDRGATVLNGKGTFTGEQKEVLYCVIARNEIFRLRNMIQQIDPHAFVAVNDVHDVLGEGFTPEERIVVNGALIQADGRCTLIFLNNVSFLTEKHIMPPHAASTPARRIYFMIENSYMANDQERPGMLHILSGLIDDFFEATTVLAIKETLLKTRELVDQGEYYQALKLADAVMKHEDQFLGQPNWQELKRQM